MNQEKRLHRFVKKCGRGVCSAVVAAFLLNAQGVALATEQGNRPVETENIARGKQASQSSTAYGGAAIRAVDGNVDSDYGHHSVTHTNFEDNAWWQVDLGKTENVGKVKLYNRGDGNVANRLSNFDVVLLDEAKQEVARQHFDSLNGKAELEVFFTAKDARYVKVELKTKNTPLSLAEVEVFRSATTQVGQDRTAPVVNQTSALKDYLFGLTYNPLDILTRKGETLENRYNTSAKEQNGEFVVVEKIKKTLSTGTADVSINGNQNVFLGGLYKANQNLLENQPELISLARAKGTVSVDLPGMIQSDSRIEADPTTSGMQSAMNTLVERWTKNYSSSHSVPARVQYESTTAYSMNQLKAKFGADFEKAGAPLKIDFEAVQKGEKQIEVVNFKQIYYTATFDAPTNPAAVFDKSVTHEDLKQRGVDSQTPPVYVSNVSYGRQIYVKFESTSKSTELKAAINAVIKGATIAPNSEWSRLLKNTSVTAVIVGGNASGAAKVVTGTVENLKELIREGANFSAQSPAVPISYKTAFLKDNAQATLQNSTDYIETKVTSYKNGFLKLHHKGAYVARYYIYWDEITYDEQGNPEIRSRQWEDNGKNRTSGFQTEIQFRGNVRNLRIKVQEKTGLVWEPWRTVYNRTDLPLVQQRTITHWGTTLNPKVDEKIVNE
ncbi:thiol-activated cytolysin family protein [Streptococcus pseudopneumoniae]|uniref:thiol-activated cytolysin family protein n=1 Tax=Streptococcus pseudopneumoniae TaxID=257758 RepID=UPI0014198249|nr:thiol-activated cytolysin family protein [Streptococcus pseudopneumoniae]NIB66778.1 thiol-activated cytolysin [Streptococcus pseudopneumoniae]